VAFGASTKYITGSNNLWFTGTNLGIGTSNAPYTLTVQGDTYVSGFVTSLGFFGPGTNITNLNATNLSSGIVPSQVISGSYSGINSVGVLSQLFVSGLTTLASLQPNLIYDSLNSPGVAGALLSATGSGIVWTSISSSGIVTGTGSVTQIAYWSNSNQLVGSNNFVITDLGSVGIGTSSPTSVLTVQGDSLINGLTIGLGPSQNIQNTAIGFSALEISTNGSNLAIGYQAARYYDQSGSVAVGYQALSGFAGSTIVTGQNVAVGYQAAQASNSGLVVAIGYQALAGTSALFSSQNGTVAVGPQAGRYLNAPNSVAMGYQAFYGSANTLLTGGNTVAVGAFAARFLNATNSVAVGYQAMQGVDGASTGESNVAIGYQALVNLTTASNNVAVGLQAANNTLSGNNNVIVGQLARQGTSTTQINTSNSVVIGSTAGRYHSGSNSVLIGSNAGAATSTVFGTGAGNVVVGYQAMQNPTSANNNVIIGQSAGSNIITGANNIIIGSGANSSNGAYQIAIGVNVSPTAPNAGAWGQNVSANRTDLGVGTYSPRARVHIETLAATNIGLYIAGTASQTANLLQIDSTTFGTNYVTVLSSGFVGLGTSSPSNILTVQGDSLINGLTVGLGSGQNSNNTVVGFQAFSVGAGIVNVSAMGYQAARFCNSASITAVGYQAMSGTATTSLSLSASSAAFGFQAGQYANAGSITAIGFQALQGTSGIFYNQLLSTAIGNQAGRYSNGNNNVVIGGQALIGSSTTALTGANNVVAGTFAARFLNASNSVAIGHQAMQGVDGLTNGTQNVAVGYQALVAITTAGQNVAVGYQAANNTQTAANNAVVGYQARLGSATTPFNSSSVVAVGSQAMKYHNGGSSVFVGAFAGFSSSIVMGTGNNNTVVGHQAMFTPTTAANNIVIGYLSGASMTAASNNIIIGYQADSNPTASYQIALGYQAFPTGNNLGAWGGNTNTTRTDLGVGTFTPIARHHVETLSPSNMGVYIAGSPSQTKNLFEIDATTNGTTLVVVGANGSMGLSTNLATQTLHIQGTQRLTGALFDFNNLPGAPSGVVSSVLHSTGAGVTWAPIKRSIITELMTGYTVSTAGIDPGIFIFPYDPNDGVSVMNFTFKRVIARCETTSATGTTTINIAKSIGTGQFFGTSILTNNILISGIYEGFSTSFGISTAQSGDKIAVNFVGTAPTFANWTIAIIARET
jgi:hypothetical protein